MVTQRPLSSLRLLHDDPRFRARVRQAIANLFAFELCDSWKSLRASLHGATLSAIVIVDPYAGRSPGADLPTNARDLLRDHPGITVVAAVPLAGARLADLRTLGEWGIAEVIVLEQDEAPAIRRLLQGIRGRPLQHVLERFVSDRGVGRARELLSAAAEVAAAGGQVEDLARLMFVSMRTAHRHFEQAGLPPPRQALAWMRILLAAELLEQPARSIESVAAACGYASDSGLRRALYDFVQMSPSELRRAGAFAVTTSAFQRALRKAAG